MSNIYSISFQKYSFKVKIHMSIISNTRNNILMIKIHYNLGFHFNICLNEDHSISSLIPACRSLRGNLVAK